MAFPDDIVGSVPASRDAVERMLNCLDEFHDDFRGDGRTGWRWVLTSGGDVMLASFPVGGVFEELSDEIVAAFDDHDGHSSPVTHEQTQRLLLDP